MSDGSDVDHRVPGADVVEAVEDRRAASSHSDCDEGRVELRTATASSRPRPRRRLPPVRCATSTNSASCTIRDAIGMLSPARSPGQPRPSQRSYDPAERVEHRDRQARARRPTLAPTARAGRSCRRRRGTHRTRTRARSGTDAAAGFPRRAAASSPAHLSHASAARARTWSTSSAMSSPNHFACSCASEWQPTLTSSAV